MENIFSSDQEKISVCTALHICSLYCLDLLLWTYKRFFRPVAKIPHWHFSSSFNYYHGDCIYFHQVLQEIVPCDIHICVIANMQWYSFNTSLHWIRPVYHWSIYIICRSTSDDVQCYTHATIPNCIHRFCLFCFIWSIDCSAKSVYASPSIYRRENPPTFLHPCNGHSPVHNETSSTEKHILENWSICNCQKRAPVWKTNKTKDDLLPYASICSWRSDEKPSWQRWGYEWSPDQETRFKIQSTGKGGDHI